KAHQAVIDFLRLMMFAMHIEQHSRPHFSKLQIKMESFDPQRFDEKEIQPGFCAISLDALDEKIIRVQFMGHYQVINALHSPNYLGSGCRLSRKNRGTKGR